MGTSDGRPGDRGDEADEGHDAGDPEACAVEGRSIRGVAESDAVGGGVVSVVIDVTLRARPFQSDPAAVRMSRRDRRRRSRSSRRGRLNAL
jgi:hypothetical protein